MITSAFSLWHGELRFAVSPDLTSRETMPTIAARICEEYGVTIDDLKGDRRTLVLTRARQHAMADMHETGRYSMPQIGYFLGRRHHTTVLHGIRAHRARLAIVKGAEDPNCRTALALAAE